MVRSREQREQAEGKGWLETVPWCHGLDSFCLFFCMCSMNSTNRKRETRNGVLGEGPIGGWKDAGREAAMVPVDQPSHWPGEGKLQRQGWRSKVEDTTNYWALFWGLFGFGPFVFFLFASKMQKEQKLFCSPGSLPLDRAVSQGFFGLGKCQIAKLSFTGQLGKNRDGTVNCSFYFLRKSITIKTASCRDLRSLPFFF